MHRTVRTFSHNYDLFIHDHVLSYSTNHVLDNQSAMTLNTLVFASRALATSITELALAVEIALHRNPAVTRDEIKMW